MEKGENMSRRVRKNIDKKNKKKNISARIIKITFILIIIVGLIAGGAYFCINKIMGKMKGEAIEKTDLNKETDLYEKIATNLTEKEFDKVITIVVFGVDARLELGPNSSRSDTIMIASVNPTTKSIKLVSIPRDTYVSIPGYGSSKINHAYSYGREALAVKTINSNFGLAIDEYVTIDFEEVIYIVNEIKGVEIQINEQERQFINKWSKESYKLSGGTYKEVKTTGLVTLSGEQTLAYMRNRDSGRGDFDRAERQRKVVTEIVNKVSKMSLVQIIKLTDVLFKGVTTNININDYFSYIPAFLKEKSTYLQNIISVQVPNSEYASDKYISGIYYFVPDKTKMKQDMYNVLYNK